MFDLHEWYLVKIYSTKPLITYRNLSKTFIREFILEILIERTILENILRFPSLILDKAFLGKFA